MPTQAWKIGDFFYVPKNLRHIECFGVFTQHGSVLVEMGEHKTEIVCSKNGVMDPPQNATPLDQILYSDDLLAILFAIHTAAVGKLPNQREQWPVTL